MAMASLELDCKIINKLAVQNGQSARGAWTKQEFVVEYQDGQYSEKAVLLAWGSDRVKDLEGFQVGDHVKVNFKIQAREYNGRWYNDIRVWKITRNQQDNQNDSYTRPFDTYSPATGNAGTNASRRASRFHQVSTDEVYGDLSVESTERFAEGDMLRPSSPYAASKAGADLMALSFGRTHGVPVTVSRCTNNYGPRQFPEKLIPLCVVRALADQPIPLYGDGRNVRDWLEVADHCRAIDLILRGGKAGEGGQKGHQ